MKPNALDQYLAAARATLVRLEPRDAYAATQRGAFLIDIRPEFQRRAMGKFPAPSSSSAISLSGDCIRIVPTASQKRPAQT